MAKTQNFESPKLIFANNTTIRIVKVEQKLTQVMKTDDENGRSGDDNGCKVLGFSMGCLINILINARLFDKLVFNKTLSLMKKPPHLIV